MDFGLKDRVVLISGAGRGIGRVTALTFAAEGAAVAVVDMDGDAADGVAGEIRATGGRSAAFACDITQSAHVEAMVTSVQSTLGGVDVLVNNAGISRDVTLLKMQESDWDRVMDVNMKGTFHCCRAVLPHMKARRWGRVINLSSRSIFGNPGQTSYSASKLAIVGFTRSLSLEQARNGITVNALAPGFVETEGIKSHRSYAQLKEAAVARIPVGFLGQPEDIASTIVFLASEQARYITGTTVFATGGRFSS
ncbi:SDR family NAD(P)-dependent oxidoreductase [Variovorax sp. KK3]|uniref:SDR family NAD(P)-dependent oxidoreductase n=1 Tax=Variovorax sp. KK3 TaxID=1855728 RepID=UPI00097C8B22|nr:SDR family NAD(P)-dependent oxidoreductase [Variovorax sp. KK3]